MDFFYTPEPEPQKTETIPQLVTRETAGMRDRYPSIEHLEAGNVGSWLQERRDQLWESAKDIETEVDAAKVITLAVSATGLVLNAVNPFALTGGAVAGAAYIWTLIKDYHQTKNFAPLPLIRGNFFEFLSAMGDNDARGKYSVDHELETLKFLEARSRMEYAMLHDKFDTVAQYLIQVETGKRFHAYRWIQQVFTRYKAMPSCEAMHDHLKDVEPDTRINVRLFTAIQSERARFVELPKPKTVGMDVLFPLNEKTISSSELFGEQPEKKKIGSDTQLNAFDTTAQVIPSRAVEDRYDPMATAKIDIINSMTERISNTLIIGIPGSGKGMLVANAIRKAKRLHPHLKIFVVDPKADQKESGYFASCDVIKSYACMDASPSTVAAWAEAAMNEYAQYAQLNERTLLIVDEGTLLGTKLNQAKSTLLVDKLTSYASGGDSAGRNVWFMMQSPYVTGASLNLSTTSQMTSIVIAFSENIGALAQWKSAKVFQQLSLDEVSELIDNSETGRAVYYGKTGRWYMMPPLTNYSGYDRDKREYLPGHKPHIQKAKEVVEEEVKPIEPEVIEEEDSEEKEVKAGFDFNKACVAMRTLKGKDWMKLSEARTNSKPVRKATRDTEDVRLIVLFLEKDGEAEMMKSDFFRIKDKP